MRKRRSTFSSTPNECACSRITLSCTHSLMNIGMILATLSLCALHFRSTQKQSLLKRFESCLLLTDYLIEGDCSFGSTHVEGENELISKSLKHDLVRMILSNDYCKS